MQVQLQRGGEGGGNPHHFHISPFPSAIFRGGSGSVAVAGKPPGVFSAWASENGQIMQPPPPQPPHVSSNKSRVDRPKGEGEVQVKAV